MIKPVNDNFETRLFKELHALRQEVKDLQAKKDQKYLSLRDTANYLGIGYGTALRDWKSWIRYGVSPIRYMERPNSGLLFRREDLDKLMESCEIIKKARNRKVSNALN